MPARSTAYNWGATGQFLAWTQNALTQTTHVTWDYRYGVPSTHTDPNGLETSWLYDDFGRRNRETRPDETYSTWTLHAAPSFSCNARAKYSVRETLYGKFGGEIRTQYAFMDSFDRPVNEYVRAFDGSSYDTVIRYYDSLGRIQRESIPHISAGCSAYSVPSPTQYAYDLLGRATQISRPVSDSDPTLQTTYLYHEGLTTRTVDALNRASTKVSNAIGAMVRSADHAGYAQIFAYNPFGNVVRVTDSSSNTLQSNVYNVAGMLTSQSDMDRGLWTFTPNALGEAASQTDANGVTTTFQYDLLGRLRTRVAPDGAQNITATYQWGSSATAKNIGQLEYVDMAGATIVGNRETYTYDAVGRLSQTQYSGAGNNYYVNRTYDSVTGFPDTLTYPQSTSSYRLKLQYEYQAGRLMRVKDFNAPTTVFWQANAMDARNNVLDEQLGNGIRTIRGYDLVTGTLDYLQSGPSADGTLQNLSYEWDRVGNLVRREDVRQSVVERFYYDDLHRLDYSTLNGTTNLDLSYDGMGNILTKTGVGTYTYHATKKHAVTATSATSRTYTYDNNGNQINRTGFAVTWYPFSLPKQINATGSNTSTFNYNGNGGRWNQVANHSGVSETTTYIGGIMEIVVRLGVTNFRHYIAGGTGTIAEYIRTSSGTNTTRYLTKDHLGSIDSITGSTGSVIVRMSYDAHGARRNEAGWSGAVPSADRTNIAANTRRGFTEHDMLDNFPLIHMNGRVFDWSAGRFISADPFIDGVGSTQGWNRYAYVANKPLSLIDPSGFANNTLYYVINPEGRQPIEGVISEARRIPSYDAVWGQELRILFDSYERSLGRERDSPSTSDGGVIEEVTTTTQRIRPPVRPQDWAQQRQFPCLPGVKCRLPSEFGKCYGPPAAPGTGKSRADLMNTARANGALAAKQPLSLAGMFWFRNQVRNGGPWDYKQSSPGYQNFGNYNYGYAGTAMGIAGGVLLRQAGAAQVAAGTSRSDWGDPGTLGAFGGEAPFGDDPLDQMYISHGRSDRSDGC